MRRKHAIMKSRKFLSLALVRSHPSIWVDRVQDNQSASEIISSGLRKAPCPGCTHV